MKTLFLSIIFMLIICIGYGQKIKSVQITVKPNGAREKVIHYEKDADDIMGEEVVENDMVSPPTGSDVIYSVMTYQNGILKTSYVRTADGKVNSFNSNRQVVQQQKPKVQSYFSVTFRNPSGSGRSVYVFGVYAGSNTFDFCGSAKCIEKWEVPEGQSKVFTSNATLIIKWISYDNPECGNSIRAQGTVSINNCNPCTVSVD